MENENLELILICGPDGSGKSTFSSVFKHAFLRSLPSMPLYQGILSKSSFHYESDFLDSSQIDLIKKAKGMGYKITCYFLFSGELLSLARCRYRAIASKENFDAESFSENYQKSFRGLSDIYTSCETVFFVLNQKEFRFIGAFDPSRTNKSTFSKALTKVKDSTERIK